MTFTYNGSTVKIEGSVKNIPVGTHGFHIHEYPLSNGYKEWDPASEEYIEKYHLVQKGVCRTSARHYDIDGFGANNPLRINGTRVKKHIKYFFKSIYSTSQKYEL